MENVQLSKTLSYILRHGAEKHKLQIHDDGYIRLADILALPKFRGATIADVEKVVQECPKQRFKLLMREEYFIRANQGHSMNINIGMQLIENASEIPVVVHGTYLDKWAIVKDQGLSKMNRQHIHFAVGR
ncbi:hypothetical protein HDV04_005843 [Boothiomyces sp. JEL0838]|nr:hypothetical protein HDV04_005843 [Boothiomyces sp. JEL0838]